MSERTWQVYQCYGGWYWETFYEGVKVNGGLACTRLEATLLGRRYCVDDQVVRRLVARHREERRAAREREARSYSSRSRFYVGEEVTSSADSYDSAGDVGDSHSSYRALVEKFDSLGAGDLDLRQCCRPLECVGGQAGCQGGAPGG